MRLSPASRLLVPVLTMLLVSTGIANALDIVELQKKIDESGACWTAGLTDVAVEHELYGRPLGGELNVDLSGAKPFTWRRDEPLPTHLDWRDKDGTSYVTKIKNQQNCGSCWAFATTGPIESAIAIAENWPDPRIDLSEQQLVSCSVGGCNGGFTTSSFDFARDNGLTTEECFPYTWSIQPCSDICEDWESRLFKIDSWQLVTTNPFNTGAIKAALQTGPVATSISIFEDFQYYREDVYEHVEGSYLGMHALTIIGYDDEGQYWIVKNSWGSFWGEDGFGKIKWGAAGIGLVTILPVYTSQGLGPEPDDDDDTADDAADDVDDSDDAGDDDDTTQNESSDPDKTNSDGGKDSQGCGC